MRLNKAIDHPKNLRLCQLSQTLHFLSYVKPELNKVNTLIRVQNTGKLHSTTSTSSGSLAVGLAADDAVAIVGAANIFFSKKSKCPDLGSHDIHKNAS